MGGFTVAGGAGAGEEVCEYLPIRRREGEGEGEDGGW